MARDTAIAIRDSITRGERTALDICNAALDRIAARCKAKGKVAGAFCMTGKRAREVAVKGFRLCSISTDGMMMRLGARLELKAARG